VFDLARDLGQSLISNVIYRGRDSENSLTVYCGNIKVSKGLLN